MKCPCLLKWVIHTCKAGDARYCPSEFQLSEYCRSSRHRRCPLYLGLVRWDMNGAGDRPHDLIYPDT
jgi:hypothetical protein